MRVASLDDLRAFRRRLVAEGYRIEGVVNHASAIGCYFFDPEGNRTEVFWVTGRPCWVPTANPIDIEQPDDVVLAEVDRVWNELRHVPVGGRMDNETATLQLSNRSLATTIERRLSMATDADRSTVLPGSEHGAQRWRRCCPLPAYAQGKPVKIGLLTVKTGPLAAGGIQMEQGLIALPQGPQLHAGRAQGRSWWWATPAAIRPAPRPRPRSWSSATTST